MGLNFCNFCEFNPIRKNISMKILTLRTTSLASIAYLQSVFNKIVKTAIRENLDLQNISAIRYNILAVTF